MTAALLDRTVTRTLESHRIVTASQQQRQDLAAVIHLCGRGAGNAYARGGFRLRAGERCGDHDVGSYLAKVNALKRQFARLAASDDPNSSRSDTIHNSPPIRLRGLGSGTQRYTFSSRRGVFLRPTFASAARQARSRCLAASSDGRAQEHLPELESGPGRLQPEPELS